MDVRKLRESRGSHNTALRDIQRGVVRLLGGLDSDMCRCVGAPSPDELAEQTVRCVELRRRPLTDDLAEQTVSCVMCCVVRCWQVLYCVVWCDVLSGTALLCSVLIH